MRWLWFALIAWIAFWWSSGAFAHHRYSAKWDFEFFMAQRKYAPPDLRDDWKWTKAQCIAESGLREDAMSPVGAQGLCQVMPNTWREVALPGSSPCQPKRISKPPSAICGECGMYGVAGRAPSCNNLDSLKPRTTPALAT